MDRWGHLADRYGADRPRKMLALDGGGIRGVIALEILDEIERQLKDALAGEADRERFRLCHFFDYIGGTSTGAAIAAGLAIGKTVNELKRLYHEHGEAMFDKAFLLKRLRYLYTADPLVQKLKEEFGGETTLEPQHLKCLLLVVTRNVTTDSPWPISSNPDAKFNDVSLPDCNLKIPLWQLVRASTAAPVFFPPEVMEWEAGNPEKTFVFVDGGVTPYNNPAFLMYRMATVPEYRLSWPAGERRLMIVSVGTGSAAKEDGNIFDPEKTIPSHLMSLPGALMYGIENDQDINCRTIGRCIHGAAIDEEIGDLVLRDAGTGDPVPFEKDCGRAFRYSRFNPDISAAGLTTLGLADIDPGKVKQMDCVDAVDDLARIGNAVAKEVDMAVQFKPFVEDFASAGLP